MSQREKQFILCVGAPKMGKSTFLGNMAKSYNQGNVCVFKDVMNYDDPPFLFLPNKTETNWRQGAAPHEPVKFKMLGDEDTYPLFLKWIKGNQPNKFRNGLLMIDDCSNLEQDSLSRDLKKIISLRRHSGYRLDIVLVYHGLSDLPIKQFSYLDTIIFFNTVDNFSYKKNKLGRFDLLERGVLEARNNYETGLRTGNKKLQYTPSVIRLS